MTTKTDLDELFAQALETTQSGKLETAIEIYKSILEIDPENEKAYQMIGSLSFNLNRKYDAEKNFLTALKINESYDNMINLAKTEFLLCDYDQNRFNYCAQLLFKAFHKNPMKIEPLMYLTNLLSTNNFHKDALVYAKKIYEIDHSEPETIKTVCSVFNRNGLQKEAIDILKTAIEKDPSNHDLHLSLSQIKLLKETDPETSNLIQFLEDGSLDKEQTSDFCYSLGNIFHKSKQYDKAWEFWQRANILRKEIETYDSQSDADLNKDLKTIFSKEFFKNLDRKGCTEEGPIFILGMPRSGTTLTEQIISSHSKVFGTGEPKYLIKAVYGPINQNDVTKQLTELSQAPEEELKRRGKLYIELLKKHTGGEQFFTDKMPHNFLYIGLIKLLMPNAKIIHCRRNPIATCFSIYSKYFHGNHFYSYCLNDLINHYRQYEDLMAHWKSIFGDDIYESNYEELVSNQEEKSKEMIEYLGLDWEDSCIEFHKNKRAVATASINQVSKKIYSGSNETWRKYEKYLGQLMDAFPDWA